MLTMLLHGKQARIGPVHDGSRDAVFASPFGGKAVEPTKMDGFPVIVVIEHCELLMLLTCEHLLLGHDSKQGTTCFPEQKLAVGKVRLCDKERG